MKKVVIVGAGKNGTQVLHIIGPAKVACFADNNPEKQTTLIEGKKVIAIECLKGHFEEYIVVISPKEYATLAAQLEGIGCEEYIVFSNLTESKFDRCYIPTSNLYGPTMLKSCGGYWFIADCWHHRILYSKCLSTPIGEWSILADDLQNPHSIDSDGIHYVCDNSDANEVVMYVKRDGKFERICKVPIEGGPHKVVYDEKNHCFLVLLSDGPRVVVITIENDKIEIQRIISWDGVSAYCRSIKIIGDTLYIISEIGYIYTIQLSALNVGQLKAYRMPQKFYGMVDIAFADGYWYLSNYTNEENLVDSFAVYAETFEDLVLGNYRILQAPEGAPYFFEQNEGDLYLTTIDPISCVGLVEVEEGIPTWHAIYKNSEIGITDLHMQLSFSHIEEEYIGKVKLDYSHYLGTDRYTDGPIEDEILAACVDETMEEVYENENRWAIFYHFSDRRKNLISWMPEQKTADVLEIGAGMGAITTILSQKFGKVDCVELSKKRSSINAYRNQDCDNVNILVGNFQDIEPGLPKYDYVTLIGVLEYASLYIHSLTPYDDMLSLAKQHLKPGGRLILAIENKLGLKYISGYKEDHVGVPYAGLYEYQRYGNIRTFGRNELTKMLINTGYVGTEFYYPYPDYKLPVSIYSDEYLPLPGDLRTSRKTWAIDETPSFDTEPVWDQICSEGVFPTFANSFLIFADTVESRERRKVVFAKFNPTRKKQFLQSTLIVKEKSKLFIEKRAENSDAVSVVKNLVELEKMWNSTIPIIPCMVGKIVDGHYQGEFISGMRLDNYLYNQRANSAVMQSVFRKLIIENYVDNYELIPFEVTQKFVDMFGEYNVTDDYSLRVTNLDLNFHNIILTENGELKCFDCEWTVDFPVPYQYVIWRAVREFCNQYWVLEMLESIQKFCESIGISLDKQYAFEQMEQKFMEYVTDQKKAEIEKRYQHVVVVKN